MFHCSVRGHETHQGGDHEGQRCSEGHDQVFHCREGCQDAPLPARVLLCHQEHQEENGRQAHHPKGSQHPLQYGGECRHSTAFCKATQFGGYNYKAGLGYNYKVREGRKPLAI